MRKIRLTELIVARGLAADEDQARRLVYAGQVIAANGTYSHPAALVAMDASISLQDSHAYVSRGGIKLAGALSDMQIDVVGMRCLDVGASTGGFTDCLLKSGAATVVSVDVAYGQFAWQLRQDPRVTLFERTNIRSLDPKETGSDFDLVCADVSFSPLRSLFGVLGKFQQGGGKLLALIKPQFELGAEALQKGGVVVLPEAHEQAISMVLTACKDEGYVPCALSFSEIKGPKGNIEFFLYAQLGGIGANIDVSEVVRRAHLSLNSVARPVF